MEETSAEELQSFNVFGKSFKNTYVRLTIAWTCGGNTVVSKNNEVSVLMSFVVIGVNTLFQMTFLAKVKHLG